MSLRVERSVRLKRWALACIMALALSQMALSATASGACPTWTDKAVSTVPADLQCTEQNPDVPLPLQAQVYMLALQAQVQYTCTGGRNMLPHTQTHTTDDARMQGHAYTCLPRPRLYTHTQTHTWTAKFWGESLRKGRGRVEARAVCTPSSAATCFLPTSCPQCTQSPTQSA